MQGLVNIQEGKRRTGIKKTHGLADACRFLVNTKSDVHFLDCLFNSCVYECAFACVWRPEVKFRYSSPGAVHLCLTGPRLTDSVGLAG